MGSDLKTRRGWTSVAALCALVTAFIGAAPTAANAEIGVYALINERYNRNSLAPYSSTDNGGYSAAAQGFATQFAGVGLRLTILKLLMFDASVATLSNDPIYATGRFPKGGGSYGRFDNPSFVRVTANAVTPTLFSIRAIAGAGLARYNMESDGFTPSKGATPEARAGLEYKPIRFIGLAVFDNVDINSVTNGRDYILNKNSVEATLAVYF